MDARRLIFFTEDGMVRPFHINLCSNFESKREWFENLGAKHLDFCDSALLITVLTLPPKKYSLYLAFCLCYRSGSEQQWRLSSSERVCSTADQLWAFRHRYSPLKLEEKIIFFYHIALLYEMLAAQFAVFFLTVSTLVQQSFFECSSPETGFDVHPWWSLHVWFRYCFFFNIAVAVL